MEYLAELLKYLVPALCGGGVYHIINWRANVRRSANQINEAEFNTVSGVVNRATKDLKELSIRIGELEKDKILILEEMSTLKDDKIQLQDRIKALEKENLRLDTALKRYIKSNNPTMT